MSCQPENNITKIISIFNMEAIKFKLLVGIQKLPKSDDKSTNLTPETKQLTLLRNYHLL